MPYEYHPDMNKRLKAIRLKLGMTQKEMAAEIGMTHPNLSILERTGKIMERTVLFVCSRWNVSYDYLVYGKGPMFIETSEEKIQLDEKYNGLIPPFQRFLLKIAADLEAVQKEISDGEGERCKGQSEASEE